MEQTVELALSVEEGLASIELVEDAAQSPYIDPIRVLVAFKEQLWSPIS